MAMFVSKELKLYSSVENNKVDEVFELLAQKDSFDINWKNSSEVSHYY